MMMTPWVLRLIIANVVIFLISGWNIDFYGRNIELYHVLKLTPALVLKMPWTVVTYMFVHGSLQHIFFNMLGLFFFGPRLELRLGGRHFLALYFVSGITGALLSFLITPPYVAIVGASGGLFGVLLAFARYWPREKIIIFPIPIPIEARVLVGIAAAASIFFGLSGRGGNTAHFAHLGGFLGGFLYLRWMEWSSPAARFKRKADSPAVRAGDAERWSTIKREDLHPVNREELDRVLAKFKERGPGSLSSDERAFLNRFSGE